MREKNFQRSVILDEKKNISENKFYSQNHYNPIRVLHKFSTIYNSKILARL